MTVEPFSDIAAAVLASREPVTTSQGGTVKPPPATLRELRLRAGLSVRDLGELAGLHKGIVSQIERGRLVATQQEADKLALALGHPAGALQTKPMLFLVEAPRD
jgi:predicted transcriptional regulator